MVAEQRKAIEQVIMELAQGWPELTRAGDPNTIDVYWLSHELHQRLSLRLPTTLPDKEIGIRIVELVEQHLISGSLIRRCSAQNLAQRSENLLEAIIGQQLLPCGLAESLAVALYAWHGCINMAKCLRKTYVVPGGEAPYKTPLRKQGYAQLQACWQAEDARGNPWVRYGVSLARLLEQKRGNVVLEDWVPDGSPHWQ